MVMMILPVEYSTSAVPAVVDHNDEQRISIHILLVIV
jgi:hypothetical protein